ncbi:MAG: hypothetical protein JW891_10625 [Candidatus Lokiarchaeota archaeon]|nr:hypothetical protein [Candidatus Lokiarchaeota archaeon]
MMETVGKWENYKGQQILICDYRNLRGKEYIAAIEENLSNARRSNRTDLLILTDIRDSVVDVEVSNKLKELAGDIKKITKKMAIVGLTGLKKLMLKFLNKVASMNIKPFEDINVAKEWLIQ